MGKRGDSTFRTIQLTVSHCSRMAVCRCGDVFQAFGAWEEVDRKHREWDGQHRNCVEVKRQGEKAFWLSFCDTERPKGRQFLGACVITVTAEEADAEAITVLMRFPFAEPNSEWLAAAITKSHRLGCNPGGQVASAEFPADHPNLAFYELGVLMDRATIKRIDRRIAKVMN